MSAEHELEMRITLRFLHEELEEASLRHDHDVRKRSRQPAEHGRFVDCRARYEPERLGFDVRQRVNGLREPDLVEHFERSGVDRVAAKVAVEIPVRLEQRHRHAGPGQEQRQGDAGGPGAYDAAARSMRLGGQACPR